MSYFSQKGQGAPIGYGSNTTDASLATMTGAKFDTADGREFVLIQNGGTALVAGNLIQGPVQIGANHTNLACSTAAIGATSITVTAGGTLITANQYQGGFLVLNAGTGIGQIFRIASHPSATSSGTCVLQLEDAVKVATSSSDTKGTLVLNPYGSQFGTDVRTSGCVVCPTTLTGPVIGVTVAPIPASTTTVPSYGFIQTKGIVGCLNDANTAIGLDLMPSANTAGAVATYVVATKCRVGTSSVAGVTTEVRPITIQL
jgi:hypothetical protein